MSTNPNTMTYGEYQLVPMPQLTINKTLQKTADGTVVGELVKCTLDGDLVPAGSGGLLNIMNMQTLMSNAFNDDGSNFLIKCNNTVLLSAYPRINSVTYKPSKDNWVWTCPYTIDLEFDEFSLGSGVGGAVGDFSSAFSTDFSTYNMTNLINTYINTASETWQLELLEDKARYTWSLPGTGIVEQSPYQLKLTHSVEAVGKRHYSSGGLDKPAWQQARDYVLQKIGYDATRIVQSGVLNLNSGVFTPYNHVRNVTEDELGGKYGVTESWLVLGTGINSAGAATEDFTVTSKRTVENDLTSITIQGTVQGLDVKSYGTNPGDFTITKEKYAAASGYYSNIKPRLFYRANLIGTGITSRALNVNPMLITEGHNPGNGTISYSYDYNDRPYNCIAGALTEHFSISDDYPHDIFAQIPILGRGAGPVLQGMNTISNASRSISIDAMMPIPTGCPNSSAGVLTLIAASPKATVDSIINNFYAELTGLYSQVFKSTDKGNWEPKTGRYSRNVTFEYQ